MFDEPSVEAVAGCDVAFVAVPSGRSQALVPGLLDKVGTVVDLGADFRLRDPAAYPVWYRFEHSEPALLAEAACGLPELFRAGLPGARLIAAPGCYVTAASIALAPLVRSGAIEPRGIIVDAASGTSGAGKELSETTHHARVNENFTAYGLLNHRHTPEIEQAIGVQVLFTPTPCADDEGNTGDLPIRVQPASRATSTEALLQLLQERPTPTSSFVEVKSAWAFSSGNAGHLRIEHGLPHQHRYDERTGYVIVLSCLDNLTKGGSGQAIQAANVALGLPETLGLPRVALLP